MSVSPSSVLVAVAVTSALLAQEQPPLFQTVICLKLQPGKSTSEYRAFLNESTMKLQQMRVDAGQVATWSFLRAVMPAGAEARCDFIQSTMSEGTPRLPGSTDDLAADLEKARVRMTASQFLTRRDSLVRLVNYELWRPLIRVGQPQKGNYLYINYMRVLNSGEYNKFEREVWKPMAEEWVKGGSMSGWLFAVKQLPGGSDVKYTAMSADVFPSLDAALKWSGIADMFRKVHPGQNYEETMQRLGKLRSLGERQLFVIDERLSKK